jgi:hypothetical protein
LVADILGVRVTAERFKPVRAGIIGIWDYVDEVFHFGDGRLVLRGNNGSGKTKALEVLVPFVLDASLDPRRLDPFSGQQRTMKSNLLYGGQTTGAGYCWLEFAKGDVHVTVGIGMQAHESRPQVKRWSFVAEGVVGDSITLVDAGRVPVVRKALVETLGSACVFDTVDLHRRAVDRRLFGLGPDRYEAMVELILTLRRPQLAKGLNPDALSKVLSDGLRTVNPELLRTSAQAFESLEQAGRELAQLEKAHKVVGALSATWRTYLRARAAERVAEVEKRKSQVLLTVRQIEDLERQIMRKASEAAGAGKLEQTHDEEHRRLSAAIDGLRRSSAYRDQGQLEDARAGVAAQDKALGGATRRLEAAAAGCARDQSSAAAAQRRWEAAKTTVESAIVALRGLLRGAGVAAEGDLDPEALGHGLTERRVAVDAVMERVVTLEGSVNACAASEERFQESIATLEGAGTQLKGAEEALTGVLDRAAADLRAWHAALVPELAERLPLDPLLEMLPGLGDDVELGGHVREQVALLERELDQGLEAASREIVDLDSKIRLCDEAMAEIHAERDDAPPLPSTRGADRGDRAGAPLWRLVQFKPSVSGEQAAGIEGALLASGLLDAWVDPPDAVVGSDRDDVHLTPGPPVSGPSLAELLQPEQAASVPAGRVAAILAGVSIEAAGVVAIHSDGRFRLGPLAGSHRPSRARYVGATARANYRATRIEALTAERAVYVSARETAMGERGGYEALLRATSRVREGLPDAKPARAARRTVTLALGRRQAARAERDQAAKRRDSDQRLVQAARHALKRAASEFGTPDAPDAVRDLKACVGRAQRGLASWVAATGVEAERRLSRDTAAEQVSRGRASEAQASQDHAEQKSSFDAATARLAALDRTLGIEVKQVLAAILTHEARRTTEAQARGEAEETRLSAEKAQTRFEGEQAGLRRGLPDKEADLTQAQAALSPFLNPDVLEALEVADTDEDFALRLAAAVSGASHSPEQLKATESRLGGALDNLDDDLGSRFLSRRRAVDGISLVELQDDAGHHGPTRFAARLDERLKLARLLLEEHEQRLFEDQLLGNLCAQMRERIDETRTLVGAMDQAMRARVLASKKSLSIAWRPLPDATADRKKLLKLLEIDARLLGADRLPKVRELLRQEVDAARQARPDREYLEILVTALDYREWHRFELTLVEPDGSKKRLSKAAHGQLSGGEKAATLHLPLFAAAHAHFAAAQPDCPRLVALDEAFAGIDGTGAPELLRLAHQFDLDWFLTGFDLWVTEPFLPGVMHYDLAHDPVSGVVSAWPILWTGQETVEGDALIAARDRAAGRS